MDSNAGARRENWEYCGKRSWENNKSWMRLVVLSILSSAWFWLSAHVPGGAITKYLGLPKKGFAAFWVQLLPENSFDLLSELPPLSRFGSLFLKTVKKFWVMQFSEDLHFKFKVFERKKEGRFWRKILIYAMRVKGKGNLIKTRDFIFHVKKH